MQERRLKSKGNRPRPGSIDNRGEIAHAIASSRKSLTLNRCWITAGQRLRDKTLASRKKGISSRLDRQFCVSIYHIWPELLQAGVIVRRNTVARWPRRVFELYRIGNR
jgi:hypothetical protein